MQHSPPLFRGSYDVNKWCHACATPQGGFSDEREDNITAVNAGAQVGLYRGDSGVDSPESLLIE